MLKSYMRLFLPVVLLLVAVFMPALAAISFPALSGRVVDEAHILSPQTIAKITRKLEEYERGTSNQLVVVTLKSLGGNDISDYGYQLGRYWQIGQKGKNNGVLLIIAPSERKVRIEVGYGLEYLLTDAASSAIINGIIIPDFRKGDMEQGVMDGTQAILDVLGGKGVPAVQGGSGEELSGFQLLLLLLFIFLFFRFARRHPFLAALALSGNSSRFGSSRLGGSRGFRGGGGSFGGGGASGSW